MAISGSPANPTVIVDYSFRLLLQDVFHQCFLCSSTNRTLSERKSSNVLLLFYAFLYFIMQSSKLHQSNLLYRIFVKISTTNLILYQLGSQAPNSYTLWLLPMLLFPNYQTVRKLPFFLHFQSHKS